MTVRLLRGDNRELMAGLDEKSVHAIVTSPPYWGLRDYGTPPLEWPAIEYSPLAGLPPCVSVPAMSCQLGLEPTLEAFIGHIIQTFRIARRVLRDDGTCWVNMGDSYAGSRDPKAKHSGTITGDKIGSSALAAGAMHKVRGSTDSRRRDRVEVPRSDVRIRGLKNKDLVGQPWRLALALQADGWWLRSDIIWNKLNPMPESCRDRPTKAHEYVFLLSKSERYYFNAEAVSEPVGADTHARYARGRSATHKHAGESAVPGTKPQTIALGFEHMKKPAGWDSSTGGAGRHNDLTGRYAPEQRLLLGAAGDGKGARMGREKGWRERERAATPKAASNGVGFGHGYDEKVKPRVKNNTSFDAAMRDQPALRNVRTVWTLATEPFKEAHFATFPTEIPRRCILAGCPPGGTVLDLFGGSGTTGMVADRLQCDAIVMEINPAYADISERRVTGDAPLFVQVENESSTTTGAPTA